MSRTLRPAFTLIEIAVVIGMAVIVLPASYSLLASSTRAVSTTKHDIEASYLASEGIEVLRWLRDQDWSSNIASVTPEATYYLGSAQTALVDTNPGTINNLYTRTVVLSTVTRSTATGNIDPLGLYTDPNTRLVTVTVTWPNGAITENVRLQTYITNFLGDE